MSHLSKISISIFLHHCLTTSKCFILMQTPLQLDMWLQSYAGFDNAKNNIKQRNLNHVFANISKTTSPTSDSFLLIMSQMCFACTFSATVFSHNEFSCPHLELHTASQVCGWCRVSDQHKPPIKIQP